MLQFTQAARGIRSNRCPPPCKSIKGILVANISAEIAFCRYDAPLLVRRSRCLFSRTSSRSSCRGQQRHSSAARVIALPNFSVKWSQPANLAAILCPCIKHHACLQQLQPLLNHLYFIRLWTMASDANCQHFNSHSQRVHGRGSCT